MFLWSNFISFWPCSRQQWAESKLLEEEVARRLERYLEDELAILLKEREVEFNAEIERRVSIERTALEKRRKEEAERKAREEEEERRRKEVYINFYFTNFFGFTSLISPLARRAPA